MEIWNLKILEIVKIGGQLFSDFSNSQILNCGYGKGFSVKEVLENFNQVLDKKIKFEIGPRRDGDSKMIIANSDKFNKLFSWKPRFNDIKYIIKTAIEWERKIK